MIYYRNTGSIVNNLESGCKTDRRSVSIIEDWGESIPEIIKTTNSKITLFYLNLLSPYSIKTFV